MLRGSLVPVGVGERRERLEVARRAELAGARDLGLEGRVEPVDADRVGLQGVDVDPGPGAEGVVARERVGEGLADRHDDVALPAEQVPPGDADEHPDQRDVEDQVAGLAQVALLGRQRLVVVRRAPGSGAARRAARRRSRTSSGSPSTTSSRWAASRSRRRGARGGRRAHLVPEDLRARQHAADERDEEQQVDRREPRRGVDLEEAQPVEHRARRSGGRRSTAWCGPGRSSAAGRSTRGSRRSRAAAAGTARCACWSAGATSTAATRAG